MAFSLIVLTSLLAGGLIVAWDLLRAPACDRSRLRGLVDNAAWARSQRRILRLAEAVERASNAESGRDGAGRRVRRARRKAMRLYLRRLRVEFKQTWQICRLLAPASPDPEFGVKLLRLAVRFQMLYVVAILAAMLGWRASNHRRLAELGKAVFAARAAMISLLETSDAVSGA